MRKSNGFTMVEMAVATLLFAAGAVYIYATFTGVTETTAGATVKIDLTSWNKQSLTRVFAELQASSLTPQDTDGVDSTEPEVVMTVEDDATAPIPTTKALVVQRVDETVKTNSEGNMELGTGKEQARERPITVNKTLRFRKVVGYRFDPTSGTIGPEWSNWITYRVNDRNQLVRSTAGGRETVVSNHIDAFDVEGRPDGTVLVTVITARRDPNGSGFRRYANALTIHPKN